MSNDDAVSEMNGLYGRMSLTELLREENLLTEFLHRRSSEIVRKKLKILREVIRGRLV